MEDFAGASFVRAAAKGLEEYGEPVSYGYWDFWDRSGNDMW
ncbi:MAG: hypothetical protein ACLR5B_11500 [Blautia sp.]